jgi:dTDP-4-dehydrorhamnose reductase
MRILVLGAGGQLGRDLVPGLVAAGHEVVGLARADLDITDPDGVASAVEGRSPEVVVNLAAYTKVDLAEREAELAFAINRDGAGLVARACAAAGVPLCHLSTDFVFTQAPQHIPRPWRVADRPDPRGVYATSKREGELACLEAGGDLFIVRTSWLYGNRGPNFPLAILRAATRSNQLRVVQDQIGCPTWTADLSRALAWLVATDNFGIHHLSGAGCCSWYQFARAILDGLGVPAELIPVSTSEWGAAAPRPSYSVLDNSEYISLGGPPLADWQDELRDYLASERDGAVAAALSGG